MPESVFSRLHGLIIGINTYKNKGHDDLRGCVSDATSLLDYFTKDLEVPLDHFRCLFNEEATRDNIINTFCSHLIENPNIQPLEPIVVYFSGKEHTAVSESVPHSSRSGRSRSSRLCHS